MAGAGPPWPGPPGTGSAGDDNRPHVAGHPPDLFRVDHLSAQSDLRGAIVRCMKLSRCLSVSTVVFGLIFAGCAGVKPMASGGTGGSGNGSGKGGNNGSGGRFIPDAGGVDIGNAAMTCGNSMLDPGEKCDDGNKMGGDGCTPLCQIEKGWVCPTVGQPCMRDAICGDGKLTAPEGCDDGNTTSGDGCSSTCTVETGWRCPVPGRACLPICGDGVIEGTENCDDGNTTNGDGCSSTCQTEPGATCPRHAQRLYAGRLRQRHQGGGRGLRLRHQPHHLPHRLHGPERPLQRRRHRLFEDLHQRTYLPRDGRHRHDARLCGDLRERKRRAGRTVR